MENSIEVVPPKYRKEKPYSVVFDSDLFISTKPSFKNYKEYIPDYWENKEDRDVAFLNFIYDNAKEILENNQDILCEETLKTLMAFTKYEFDDIYVPSFFNPENTGVYDLDDTNKLLYHKLLYVEGYTYLKKIRFVIKNQDGVNVFETFNRNVGWDGKSDGAIVPNGDYSWNLTGILPDDEKIKMNSVIHIHD